jgi:hypothetical protein
VEKYEAEKTAREHEALLAAVMGGAVTGSSSRPHKIGDKITLGGNVTPDTEYW